VENDPDKQDEQSRQLVLAALAIDKPSSAAADKPDMAELWDWVNGSVDPQRALQIRSHVARDPELYAQWRELRLALAEDAAGSASDIVAHSVSDESFDQPAQKLASGYRRESEESKESLFERFFNWLSPPVFGGGLATAAILGVAVSIGLNQSQQSQDFWTDWQSPKGLPSALVAEDIALSQSFLAGMGKQMQALSIPATGPTGQKLPQRSDVQPCEAGDDLCASRRDVMAELGQLSVTTKIRCVVDQSGEQGNQGDQARVVDLSALAEQDELMARFMAPVRQWATSEQSDARCSAVNALIQRSLSGAAGVN